MDKLTGHGRPPKSLAGKVGQHYEDLDTGDVYECRIANKYSTMHGWPVGGYIWELRAKGEDIQEFYGAGSDESPNVKTINGVSPDENGNVDVAQPDMSKYYDTTTSIQVVRGTTWYKPANSELKTVEIGDFVKAGKLQLYNDDGNNSTVELYADGGDYNIDYGNGGAIRVRANPKNSSTSPMTAIKGNEISISEGGNATCGITMVNEQTYHYTALKFSGRVKNNSMARPMIIGADFIVPSSTEGSTKLFKITVDDAGTLSATEVTLT